MVLSRKHIHAADGHLPHRGHPTFTPRSRSPNRHPNNKNPQIADPNRQVTDSRPPKLGKALRRRDAGRRQPVPAVQPRQPHQPDHKPEQHGAQRKLFEPCSPTVRPILAIASPSRSSVRWAWVVAWEEGISRLVGRVRGQGRVPVLL